MSKMIFNGFQEPRENWSKLPHELIDALDQIDSIGQLKIILYILRHTWGYHDTEKKITLDEFVNGRKRRDGSRIDNGTGLSKPTVINGIKRAVDSGFIVVDVDESDLARVKKVYSLSNQGLKNFTPDVKEFNPRGKESLHRTEKDTLGNILKKENIYSKSSIHQVEYIPEDVIELRTELVSLVADQMWEPTESKFNEAAYLLYEQNVTREDVKGFGDWWKANTHYSNKNAPPALKTLLQKWKEYKQPEETQKDKPQFEQVVIDGEIMMQRIEQ